MRSGRGGGDLLGRKSDRQLTWRVGHLRLPGKWGPFSLLERKVVLSKVTGQRFFRLKSTNGARVEEEHKSRTQT